MALCAVAARCVGVRNGVASTVPTPLAQKGGATTRSPSRLTAIWPPASWGVMRREATSAAAGGSPHSRVARRHGTADLYKGAGHLGPRPAERRFARHVEIDVARQPWKCHAAAPKGVESSVVLQSS
jgi:hypothetical protein